MFEPQLMGYLDSRLPWNKTSFPGVDEVFDTYYLGHAMTDDGDAYLDVYLDICPGGLVFIGTETTGWEFMKFWEDKEGHPTAHPAPGVDVWGDKV